MHLRSVTAIGADAPVTATVNLTNLTATTGSAFDPALAARTRRRDVGGDIKITERDARVAFVSTGDHVEGENPAKVPQLFLWEEAEDRFRQLTRVADPGAEVNRPSIAKGGTVIAFESTANLTPEALDPLDPARVGNPAGVRQIFLWRAGQGVRQLTWSDDDCFAPRLDIRGRFVLFCSKGDPISGGNPEGNFEIFVWTDRRSPVRRLRQLTQTTLGHSVLPRPTLRASAFTFLSTAAPPRREDGERTQFGEGEPQATPQALAYDRGHVTHVHGFSDAENLARVAEEENPVVSGPPAPGYDLFNVYFATNDWHLNPPVPDDGDEDREEERERRDDADPFAFHVARATRFARGSG